MHRVKTYDFCGRKVYIAATIREPLNWRSNGRGSGFPYRTAPYRVKYVDDDTLAIDAIYAYASYAKESIEYGNKAWLEKQNKGDSACTE